MMSSPSSVEQIGSLLSAGLISEEAPGQFAFRHALIREAVYANLLLKDRRHYHRAIGETIAHLYPESLDLHLSDLSFHFSEAGLWEQALEYGRRAGERARAMFAPHEAIEHLARAVQAATQLNDPSLSQIYRERGHAYEILGDFEHAQADYSASLSLAQTNRDPREEWEALVGLGFLWAARSYAKTGEYFRKALDLARTLDDPHILGHTLNRVGNWHLNVGEGDQALEFHKEALELFTRQNDSGGIAESADLLGLTNAIVGNWAESSKAFDQAIELFRSLNERRGLASSLSNRGLRGVFSVNDFVPSDHEHQASVADEEEALEVAREIGWRAGEAYSMAVLGALLCSEGRYDRSIGYLNQSLRLSEEIGHRQWSLFAHMTLAGLYLDLIELDLALGHAETALQLATEIRSTNFERALSGLLATTLVRRGDDGSLARASQVLDSLAGGGLSFSNYTQHEIDNACIELAIARGKYAEALDLVDTRLEFLVSHVPHVLAARLRLYRAQALVGLHRLAESEEVLSQLLERLPQVTGVAFRWRVHVELGDTYRRQRRRDNSEAQFREALRIIGELAGNVSDPVLRENFLAKSRQRIPAALVRLTRPGEDSQEPTPSKRKQSSIREFEGRRLSSSQPAPPRTRRKQK